MFLLNSRLAHFTATFSCSRSKFFHITKALLLPKLRSQIAEFLNDSSLERLRILISPTCVGLWYGHLLTWLEVFLGSVGSVSSRDKIPVPITSWGWMIARIYQSYPSTGLDSHFQSTDDLPSCVTPSLITVKRWYRNINRLSIVYASQPRLRCRLTLGGLTFPRKP